MTKESDKWLEATNKIRAKKEAESARRASQISEARATEIARANATEQAVSDVATFINGEDGERALNLLEETGRYIILGNIREDSEYNEGYILMSDENSRGFMREMNSRSALAAAFTGGKVELTTEYEPMTPGQIVVAWTRLRHKPEELMPFIYAQLNAIAQEVQ